MAAPSENKGVPLNGEIVTPDEYLRRTGQVKGAMVPAKRTKIWGEEYILARLVDEGEEYW